MSTVRARAASLRAAAGCRAPSAAGQGIVEFGLILALAVLVAVAILVLLRPQLAWALSMIGSEVDKSGWLAAALAFA
jgi:Flp pilus assembly pilin Flp